MEVRDVPLSQIEVGDRFREDLGNIEELAESIRTYGVLQPITIGLDMRLCAGGRRYQAALLAGLDSIPAVIRDVGGEVDYRELELVENIHRKDLTWQERARLEKRIYDLKGSIRQVADAVEGSKSDVERHLELADALEHIPELAKCKTQADALKVLGKLKESVIIQELTKRAKEEAEAAGPEYDTYRMANSNYHVGDALEGMRECREGIFNFAEVDPPYGIGLHDLKRTDGAPSTMEQYTEIPQEMYCDFLLEAASGTYRVLQPNSFCVWWFGFSMMQETKTALTQAGFTVCDIPGIWSKGGQGQTMQPSYNLANCYEPFFVCRKGSPVLAVQGHSNIFEYPPVAGQRKIHATERPLSLMEEILRVFTFPQQRVIVPFLGSGVTLRACYKLDRPGMGWDLSEETKNKFLLQVREDIDNG